MGFLDRINANKVTAEAAGTTGAKKPNPLARKNPLAARKPSIALKPAEQEAVETKEEVKAVAPVKESETTTEEVIVEAKQETVVEEKSEAVVETPQEEVAKTTEEAKQEPAKETAKEKATAKKPTSKKPAEAKEEKEAEAEKEEPKAEEKAPAKKTTRRNTAKKKETASAPEEATFYEIPTTEIDYAEAVEAIRSPFRDETWEAFKAEIQEDLSKIEVSDDLNPGALKIVISELSILRDKIWFPLQEAKTEFERYASKEPEGLIERVKRINSVGGNNETERRRAGILACMNYETSAGTVNLYELMDESRERYSFLKAVDESIKFKKDILITMNGALKLEKDLL